MRIQLLTVAFTALAALAADAQSLIGFASMPADTFAAGPTSGQLIAGANGRVPPFVDRQPVQGFSSILKASNGEFLAMCDNGFGVKPNSPDYVLRVYRVAPDFRTRNGGTGRMTFTSFITLSDPHRRVNFPIVADGEVYPDSAIPVAAAIREGRLLTGGDFDIESFREAPDGSLWFGDEFGPFLIHTDQSGVVLEAPYPIAGIQSPQNPFLGPAGATLPRSKGFEGMAITPDGKHLYPMLEGALVADPDQQRLIINEFDIKARAYTGRQWFYKLDASSATGQSMGDLTAVTKRLFLVIERDNFEGAAAQYKKIFLVDLDDVDEEGFLIKHEVANLLNLSDPRRLGGGGTTFRFPFQTIESVIPLGEMELGVLNDNNYPFSAGRTPGESDPNEFIVIRLDRPLVQYTRRY